MKERKYRHRTKILGIPVAGFGHSILPSVEMKKWQFVENLLLTATRGMDSCLFKEGALSVEKQDDDNYAVVLSTSTGGISLSGVAGGRYFECRGKVKWSDMIKGSKYFLYIVSNVRTSDDPRNIRAVASKYRVPTSAVLVASLDLSGEIPALNLEPEGKASKRMMESHVGLSKNPHGKMMVQEELAVRRLAIAGSLEIDENGPLDKEGIREASSLCWRVYRVKANGREGVAVEADGAIRAAHASFEGDPGEGGSLWLGYHGIDENAGSVKTVIVYSACKEVMVRVSVLCER